MRVLVAMSGGVDSTLAAALLAEEGHEVTGATLLLRDGAPAVAAAAAAAAELGIPHSVVDVRERFEREVVAPFVSAYAAGTTPNPCARCNPRVKFAVLLELADRVGAQRLATGHYARLEAVAGGGTILRRGADLAKDQSYFLAGLPREALGRLLFPLGPLAKEQVRRLARARGLAAAAREESQEVCFVPDGGAGEFVARRLPPGTVRPGPVVDREGRRLGTHRGLVHYTVGQRRGLGFAAGSPRYVVAIDAAANAVIAGAADELLAGVMLVRDVGWLVDPPAGPLRAAVRIRSRHRPAPATLEPLGGDAWLVRFDEPQRAVTPGQAAVFHDGETLLGAGTIAGPRA